MSTVQVLSESNLRASPSRPRHYFEHATIRFPAGVLVRRCLDNSETTLSAIPVEVHAKRSVRKYDWKPRGPWLFIYASRSYKWEETRAVCPACGV